MFLRPWVVDNIDSDVTWRWGTATFIKIVVVEGGMGAFVATLLVSIIYAITSYTHFMVPYRDIGAIGLWLLATYYATKDFFYCRYTGETPASQ